MAEQTNVKAIRYFKLQNHGAAVIDFLIKDSAGGRTVFEGGPNIAAGGENIIDLAQTPGIDDKNGYRMGAEVKAGRNITQEKSHPVDFSTNLVGVWKFTGTTISGTIHFQGYETHDETQEVTTAAAGEIKMEARKD